jgi:hypothetical protein
MNNLIARNRWTLLLNRVVLVGFVLKRYSRRDARVAAVLAS